MRLRKHILVNSIYVILVSVKFSPTTDQSLKEGNMTDIDLTPVIVPSGELDFLVVLQETFIIFAIFKTLALRDSR